MSIIPQICHGVMPPSPGKAGWDARSSATAIAMASRSLRLETTPSGPGLSRPTTSSCAPEGVDARDERGHDDESVAPARRDGQAPARFLPRHRLDPGDHLVD